MIVPGFSFFRHLIFHNFCVTIEESNVKNPHEERRNHMIKTLAVHIKGFIRESLLILFLN